MRKISRELKINRETVRRYLAEYERARSKLSSSDIEEKALIEDLVHVSKYNISNRGNQKFTEEVSREADRLTTQCG